MYINITTRINIKPTQSPYALFGGGTLKKTQKVPKNNRQENPSKEHFQHFQPQM